MCFQDCGKSETLPVQTMFLINFTTPVQTKRIVKTIDGLTGSEYSNFRTRFSLVLLTNLLRSPEVEIPCSSSVPVTNSISTPVAASSKLHENRYSLLEFLSNNSKISQNASIQNCAKVYHVVSNATPWFLLTFQCWALSQQDYTHCDCPQRIDKK